MNKQIIIGLVMAVALAACDSGTQPNDVGNEDKPVTEDSASVSSVSKAVDEKVTEAKEVLDEQGSKLVEQSKSAMENVKEKTSETLTDSKELVATAVAKTETIAKETGEKVKQSIASVKEKITNNSHEEGLELAKKSGCFACHSVEKKIVGPAWKDIAERYKTDDSVRQTLITKVSKGGRGNWTEVTGGVPMPPYSPRVSDENIAKLVDFVLTL